MGSSERKERQKVELQQQILSAAKEIVSRDGFAALTMRKIADAIEYAPGTIYLYFENRDEIAKQLCRQGYRELLECLKPTAAILDPRARLRAMAGAYVQFGSSNSATYRLIFMEDPKFTDAALSAVPIPQGGGYANDSSNGAGIQAFQLLVAVFDALKANRSLRADADSTRLAEIFWTSLHGIVSLKLTCSSFLATTSEELVTSATDLFLAGLE
ncbi:TetR/AcrR family transcriptional regulator [Chamaesiphon sp. VAR_69_metabat_338]|uniref:TetR/AcrR family transcriptional regulator n=1 Tax=Chamaesiphon sp. VAR_69_metabat_338 TaxID=2964704 RepID=UPI00286E6AF5|nr:TetR/AcrR family transcriptional regulator [Chamaesiphon sp. VAR_69_metabat_338]